jgi:DNA-binding transcriptional MerR regulator
MASAAQAAHEIPEKSLFRIGEVSRLTATKTFVLRYWESEFPTLQPVKSPSGHRLYRREDIETVFEIKRLLYEEGFTIAGARRHLAEQNGANGTGVAAQNVAVVPHAPPGEAAGVNPGATSGETSPATHNVYRHEASPTIGRSTAKHEPASRLSRKLLLDLHEELLAILTLLERE